MERRQQIWLRIALPILVVAFLGLWSVVALESAGWITVAHCDQSSCAGAFVAGVTSSNF